MIQLNKIPNTKIIVKDKVYLFFSGTSYLGISSLTKFQKIVAKKTKKWGTAYGSSRKANIQLNIYKKAELFFAKFLQKEQSVTVSSGTLAGIFSLRALAKLTDVFFYMPKTHPAILRDGAVPIYTVNNVLNTELLKLKNKTICILSDAIAMLETAPFSFNFLDKIHASNTIYVLLDESHSLGVLGENGCGISNQITKNKRVKIIITSSLGKAFGINGGVIAGDKKIIEIIKKDSLFIGSAGMSAAYLDAFMQAQKKGIYKKQLVKLKKNVAYVFSKLEGNNQINATESYPVFFHKNEEIGDKLMLKNIIITSFYYPTSNKKINRIVINANHTKAQLNLLIKSLSS
ncbi:aminotransferase class I/II-fold pyridoxal phosphate-dependent enzyme [Tenacibaculum sp. UWU-22]|uniref:aminotransferase class I/II-fold pyridoxal phosphate-dependent enzyme n=1 Tax=Tenacibaculum sp. UWU-22 TaxID=3234187 RepID=UPI0034DB4B9C